MTKLKDEVIQKKYFSIGEVALKIGRQNHWIRFQMQQFPDFLGFVHRRKGNNNKHVFTEDQLDKLKVIRDWTMMNNEDRIRAYAKSLKA